MRIPRWGSCLIVLVGVGVAGSLADAQPGGSSLQVTATSTSAAPPEVFTGEKSVATESAQLVSPPVFVAGPFYSWALSGVTLSRHGGPPASATGGYYAAVVSPNAPTTKFRMIPHRAGSWVFQLTVTVTGTIQAGSATAPVSGTAMCSVSLKADENELIIKRKTDGGAAYQEISKANQNVDVLPGEYMDLKVEDKAAKGVANVAWTIDAKTFKSYTATLAEGKLTALAAADLGNQTVQFYWANDGAKNVSVKADVGKKQMTAKTALTVHKPIVRWAKAGGIQTPVMTGDVEVGDRAVAKGVRPMLLLAVKGPPAMQGGPPTWKSGIQSATQVDVPKGFAQGEWNYTQLIGTLISRKYVNKGKESWADADSGMNGATKVLDVDRAKAAYPTKGPFATAKLDSITDGPGSFLDIQNVTYVKRADTLSTYVMFKPAGANSALVPLQRYDWGWKGEAEKGNAGWALVPMSAGKTLPTSPPVADDVHPVWSKNLTDVQFVVRKN